MGKAQHVPPPRGECPEDDYRVNKRKVVRAYQKWSVRFAQQLAVPFSDRSHMFDAVSHDQPHPKYRYCIQKRIESVGDCTMQRDLQLLRSSQSRGGILSCSHVGNSKLNWLHARLVACCLTEGQPSVRNSCAPLRSAVVLFGLIDPSLP